MTLKEISLWLFRYENLGEILIILYEFGQFYTNLDELIIFSGTNFTGLKKLSDITTGFFNFLRQIWAIWYKRRQF